MTDVMKLAGFAVAAALIAMTVRGMRKEMGAAVALAAGALMLSAAALRLSGAVGTLEALAGQAGMQSETLALLFKVLGIAYITEFASHVCKDAGESGLAAKCEMCGKVMLFVLALPLLSELMETVMSMI